MIFGSNLANFIAYIYHVVFGRILGPESYGELASLLGLIGLITSAFGFLSTVILKFVASAEKNEVGVIITWFRDKSLFLGIVLSGLYLIASPMLSRFLAISISKIIIIIPILLFFFLTTTYKSALQGLLMFKEIVILSNTEMVLRLILGIVLVGVGLSTFGAVFGIVLATLITLLLMKHYIQKIHFKANEGTKFDKTQEVIRFSIPMFFSALATNSFFSSDMMLVKHYFSPYEAGLYASLSTLGKIIFFGVAPIGSVMFPLISRRHSKGQGYTKIFTLSVLLTILLSGCVLLVYLFFPTLMINILFGGKYTNAAPNLFWFGLFMSIFTLSTIVYAFYYSRGKTEVTWIMVICATMQILGIIMFHSTIFTVIKVSTISVILMLVGLALYYFYEEKYKRKLN